MPALYGEKLIPLREFLILKDSDGIVNALKLKELVIAVDGPAASGKSSTAKLAATRLGYLHVDTGAMYRAVALKVLKENISLTDCQGISRLVEGTNIRLERRGGETSIFLDDRDVTRAIRSRAVTNAASVVSAVKRVREVMVREQRRMGEKGGIVVEGRDIGTVVFPDADLKIFMVANVDERARRRQRELREQGTEVDVGSLKNEIILRDRQDSERDISPLKKADDAIILDTSEMKLGEQVEYIVNMAKEILQRRERGIE